MSRSPASVERAERAESVERAESAVGAEPAVGAGAAEAARDAPAAAGALERRVREAVEALGLRGRPVLVAVSGGNDSVCLLALLHRLARPLGLRLAVGHVDHGLRGEASRADARFVAERARALGLRFDARRVAPDELREGASSRERLTLQEAARALRYRALYAMADEWAAAGSGEEAVIATAHHADDQAETVLLRVLRGCGPEGLGGIPERSRDGRVVRPLLGVGRAELEGYRAARGLAFREDASNARDDYARNRLRHHVVPQLTRDFNPALLRAVVGLAEAQRRESEWLEALVAEEYARRIEPCGEAEGAAAGWQIAGTGWDTLPEALARRLVKRLLEDAGAGRDTTRTHILRVRDFLIRGGTATPGTVIELPGGLRLAAERGCFRLVRLPVTAVDGC